MHFSGEENKMKSKDKIAQNLSEIESLSRNIQKDRTKIQILTDELLKEGVELIKVSDKLTDVNSILKAENKLKQSHLQDSEKMKAPVSIRKDHFPYDPKDYITGSYRVSDFSQTKSFNNKNNEPLISETLGSRKKNSRSKGTKIKSNQSNQPIVLGKRSSTAFPMLPILVFILVFFVVLFGLDFYFPNVIPFFELKSLLH
ncbi:MAG: hypothetical protein K0R71_389 [Bacillales bacterium]|jgi:hypothetical protein|nr:hypothetical protein [Bacillales bacterium]